MNIKERFTVYNHINKEFEASIWDHVNQEVISEEEFIKIAEEEYPDIYKDFKKNTSRRENSLKKVVDNLEFQLSLYNTASKKEYQIDIEDVIFELKERRK